MKFKNNHTLLGILLLSILLVILVNNKIIETSSTKDMKVIFSSK